MEWEGTKSAVGEGGIPHFGDHFLIIYVICVSCLLLSTRHLIRDYCFLLRVEGVLDKRTCTNLLDSI